MQDETSFSAHTVVAGEADTHACHQRAMFRHSQALGLETRIAQATACGVKV